MKSGYIRSLEHAANLIDYAGNKLEARELVLEDGTARPIDDEIYLEYISTRPSVELAQGRRHGLFTLSGDADMEAEKLRLREHADSIRWSQIISLTREDATRTGFDNRAAWQRLIRARAPEIAKAYNMSLGNMVVNAAFHNKDHHPHVHLLFYSTDNREGYVRDMAAASERLRSLFFNDIFHEDVAELKERKTEQRRQLDAELEKALTRICGKEYAPPAGIPEKLVGLSEQLIPLRGKKSYGYLPPALKETVRGILKDCLTQDLQLRKIYELYLDTQRAFIQQYVDDPEKIETRMREFEQRMLEPGKNDPTRLHNIIIKYAAAISTGEETIQKNTDEDTPQPDGESSITGENDLPASEPATSDPPSEPDALDRLIEKAEGGNAWAQYRLGMVCLTGRGLPRDENAAVILLQMSAEQENPYAAYELAKVFRTRGDDFQSSEYFYKSFKLFQQQETITRDDRIQVQLAKMYLNGEGCFQDPKEAVGYYTLAADQGNQYAQYTLAKIYEEGKLVPKDMKKATLLLARAALNESRYAQYALGKLLTEGVEVEKNEDAGRFFLDLAARQGDTRARKMIEDLDRRIPIRQRADTASMWTKGYRDARAYLKGTGVERDPEKARRLMADEAERGNPLALYDMGTISPDDLQAQEWFRKAFDAFTQEEEKTHDPYLQYRIGKMYRDGYGIDRSDEKAAEWFHKATDQGNQFAQYALGSLYRSGKGVERSDEMAAEYFREAADQGNVFAQYELGRMFEAGTGVAADPQDSADLYREAYTGFTSLAERTGDSQILYRLGYMTRMGQGTAADAGRAVALFERSATLGNADAQYALAKLWLSDPAYANKTAEALEWMSKAAAQGNDMAQFALGRIYQKGEHVQKNIPKAVELFTQSASHGNQFAQYALARLYLDGTEVPKDIQRAIPFLEASAGQGNQFAQYSLGRLYLDGTDVLKDEHRAFSYLASSANQGNQFAQYQVGRMFLEGTGCERSVDAAVRIFQLSADQGNQFAQYALGRLYLDGTDVLKDEHRAFSYLASSANQGNQFAQYQVGRMLLDGTGYERNVDAAIRMLQLSTGQRNENAQYRLGCLYLDGTEVTRDAGRGLAFLRQAADNNNQFAQYRLGREYHCGENIPRDETVAREYLSSSAAQGNSYARQLLSFMDGEPARKAAYATALMMREIAFKLVGDSRREAFFTEHGTPLHRSRMRRKFTLRQKIERPTNYSDEMRY